MNYDLKAMAKKVGYPDKKAPGTAEGYNSGKTGNPKNQADMRKIINQKGE